MMKKIAIVGSGGGMRCAYSAGVILALVEKCGLTNPDIVVGGSGSTGTFAYFVAKQYDSIKNIWENLIPSKKFISLWRWDKLIDIDYLIDDIFKKKDILNTHKIKVSKIKLFISVINNSTGNLEYFNNKDDVDIYEVLRASNAMPIAYNRPVKINGNKYTDGAANVSLNVNIKKAIQEGAEIIIAIDSATYNFLTNLLLRFNFLFKKKSFHYKSENDYEKKIPKDIDKKVIVIKPSCALPVHVLDNNRDHIIKTIKLGYNDLADKAILIKELCQL